MINILEKDNIIEQLKKNDLFSSLNNDEISNIISKVKYNNIDAIKKKIKFP